MDDRHAHHDVGTSPTSCSRQPAGTPAGGQFAPEAHAEPEVALGTAAAPPGQPSESRREVDADGTVRWFDAVGNLHRDDGPAYTGADGSTLWYQHGKLHRDDGPAVERPDGAREWFRNGRRHRDDGPAMEFADGATGWFRDGQWHRDGGPAYERPGLGALWYQHDHLHRDGGPAIERADGGTAWFQHGERHRDDGPAVERADGSVVFWVHGRQLTEDEFRSEARRKASRGHAADLPAAPGRGQLVRWGVRRADG